jgi:hypothetical protein
MTKETETAIEKPNYQEMAKRVVTLDEVCPVHKVHYLQFDRPLKAADEAKPRLFAPVCPVCHQEAIEQKAIATAEDALNQGLYLKSYNILESKSTVPKELKAATFDNFIAETPEEKQLLEFAKGQAKKYLDGMAGNTLITGGTGVGKSHLSYAMAKAINEGYRAKNEPKSVLFISLTEIIKEIKNGWSYGRHASLTEHEALNLMTSVDYLILDDLGAKNAEIKPKGDWEQDFLFDILNNRDTTIINTNLSSDELRKVYNERNTSRILKGLEGNSFKVFGIKDKRYNISTLKQKS